MNEANAYQAIYTNEDIIEKLGEVDVYDSKKREMVKMQASDVMKVVSDALYKMHRDYNYLYQFITKCKIMYIPTFPSKIADTMAVDNFNNLWINLTFVYDTCKMDSDRVFGILFHEMFHIFFNHLLRFDNEFPKEMFATSGPGVYKAANMKANLCMDYEVNASMVDDGIVSPEFFVIMNGLYKKEYTGMTWEEILHKYGDKEYDEWLSRNGKPLDQIEKKILEAIEEAAKVLMDPDADDADKRDARKRLKKKLDEILGRREEGEKTLQDQIDELGETKLADHGDVAQDLEKLSDDLNRDPERMTADDLANALKDMDKLADDIIDSADDIAKDFGKNAEDVAADAQKAREAVKDAMQKINKGGLTKEEKQELMDKAKDALEDIISDEVEKERLKKAREERDAAREEKKKERLKKTHPLRKIIIVLKNLADLYGIKLISEETKDILEKCIDATEVLTEKKFSDMKKRDMKDVSDFFGELKKSLLPDMVALIEDETILNKTEEDMQDILNSVFEVVYNAFRRIFDTTIDDAAKGALIKMAAQKLRIIGKVLKTQKKWRVGDDFKKAYMDEMKRLMEIRKEGGDEALFKELYDAGVIDVLSLDENGKEILDKLLGGGEIDDTETGESGGSGDEETTRYSEINDDVDPYEGKMYYIVFKNDDGETIVELSDMEDVLNDSDYEKFGVRFEKDFPEYSVEEMMESVFDVFNVGTMDYADFEELKKKLEDNPDYQEGEW